MTLFALSSFYVQVGMCPQDQKLYIVFAKTGTTTSISASNLFRYEALFFTFFACIIEENGLKLT
jgi:hypothetical protein